MQIMKQYFECVQTLAIQVCWCVNVQVGGWGMEGGIGERGDIRNCGQEQTLAPGYLASSPSSATYNLYKMELNSYLVFTLLLL